MAKKIPAGDSSQDAMKSSLAWWKAERLRAVVAINEAIQNDASEHTLQNLFSWYYEADEMVKAGERYVR